MKPATLIRKSILSTACFCLTATLFAQTPMKSQEESASSVTGDSAQKQPLPKSSVISPASIPAIAPARWNPATLVLDRPSIDESWVRVEPGVLSFALRMEPTVAPPNQRYGAAPAIMNFNFGRQ